MRKIIMIENCYNCINSYIRDSYATCTINNQQIKHYFLMGGSKKCECYKRRIPKQEKFIYPKKEILIEYEFSGKSRHKLIKISIQIILFKKVFLMEIEGWIWKTI